MKKTKRIRADVTVSATLSATITVGHLVCVYTFNDNADAEEMQTAIESVTAQLARYQTLGQWVPANSSEPSITDPDFEGAIVIRDVRTGKRVR